MEIKTIKQQQRKLINEYSDNSMCNSNSQSANEAYSSEENFSILDVRLGNMIENLKNLVTRLKVLI